MNFNSFSQRYGLLLLGLLFVHPLVWAYVPLDRIVAVVNHDVIMLSELETKLETVREKMQQEGIASPPMPILAQQVLEGLIQNRIQLQLAARAGISINDETLNQTINTIAENNAVSLAQFREILELEGYSYEQFRENIRDEIVLTQLRKRQVENRIIVSEREIDDFLASQELQSSTQTEVRLSHILLSLPATATEENVERIREVAARTRGKLLAGTDFAKTAMEISDSADAENGGDIGWRKIEDIPTIFADYVLDMKKGAISQVIESPSGFHIIKMTDVKDDEQHRNIVEQTHARHILIKTDELTTAEVAREKLMQLRTRIENGDDFSQLAKGHSDDAISAMRGGDLGWRSPGDFTYQFQDVLDNTKIGEISTPFQSDFGWHILQVLDRRQHDNTETISRNKARNAIYQKKLEDITQSWTRRLRNEAYVEYRLDET